LRQEPWTATFRCAGLRYSSPCSAIITIVTHIPDVFNRPSRINIRKDMPLAQFVTLLQVRNMGSCTGQDDSFLCDVAAADRKPDQRTLSPAPETLQRMLELHRYWNSRAAESRFGTHSA
jgi:hypothetical protein